MKETLLAIIFFALLAAIYFGGPVSQSMFHFLVVMTLVQMFSTELERRNSKTQSY